MVERTVTVRAANGLHCGPVSEFVRRAQTFDAAVTVVHDGREVDGGRWRDVAVDGGSIFGMAHVQGAPRGTVLTIRAEGPDAREAVDALAELLEVGIHTRETTALEGWKYAIRGLEDRLDAILLEGRFTDADRAVLRWHRETLGRALRLVDRNLHLEDAEAEPPVHPAPPERGEQP